MKRKFKLILFFALTLFLSSCFKKAEAEIDKEILARSIWEPLSLAETKSLFQINDSTINVEYILTWIKDANSYDNIVKAKYYDISYSDVFEYFKIYSNNTYANKDALNSAVAKINPTLAEFLIFDTVYAVEEATEVSDTIIYEYID